MSFPKTIKIAGHEYAMVLHDGSALPTNEDYAGRIDLINNEIHISTGRPPSAVQETLLHEILHGIDWNRRLELSERQIDQMAAGLIDVIRSNPRVFARGIENLFVKGHDRGRYSDSKRKAGRRRRG